MYRVFLGSLARKLASHLFFPCETLQAITKTVSSSESGNSAIECMSINLSCLILQGEQVPGSILRVGQKAICSVIEAARARTNSLFTNKKESSLGLPESHVFAKFALGRLRAGELAAIPVSRDLRPSFHAKAASQSLRFKFPLSPSHLPTDRKELVVSLQPETPRCLGADRGSTLSLRGEPTASYPCRKTGSRPVVSELR
jgi:hypothetical protein